MRAPIEVSYKGFDAPVEIRERIDELVAQLDKFEDHIVDGRVAVDAANKHGSGTVVEVSVTLDVKGKTIAAKREGEYPSPAGERSVSKAATEAFRAAQRQLKEHAEKQTSHQVKALDHQMQRGRIGSLDRIDETGFVEMPNGVSLFFAKAVLKDTDFNALAEGDTVMVHMAAEDGPYGPQASSVELEVPEVRSR